MWIITLYSVMVSCRAGAKKVEAKGFFVGAEVVRGRNWKFGDQDGMTQIHFSSLGIAISSVDYNSRQSAIYRARMQ